MLSPAERSIVAIARAVSRNVDLLILDEPTASLPEADVERLFTTLRALKTAQCRGHLCARTASTKSSASPMRRPLSATAHHRALMRASRI